MKWGVPNLYLSVFVIIDAIWLRLWAKPPSKNEKRPLQLTSVSHYWQILRTWLQVLKGPAEGCMASYKLVDVRNNTVTSHHGGLEKFSTVTFTSRSIGLIAAVCMQTASPITFIKITVKNQDVQKRQSFLVSWYHVSFVWVIAPSTLLIELVLRETTRPSANKGPGLLCSARRGLGRGHEKTRSHWWEGCACSLQYLWSSYWFF